VGEGGGGTDNDSFDAVSVTCTGELVLCCKSLFRAHISRHDYQGTRLFCVCVCVFVCVCVCVCPSLSLTLSLSPLSCAVQTFPAVPTTHTPLLSFFFKDTCL
jgi:hypothetical protein